MDIYKDETEFTQIHMFQRVVDMFENNPRMQHIVRLGLLANMGYGDELDFPDEDDYDYDNWVPNNSHGFPRSSDRGLSGNQTRSSDSAYQLPLHYYTAVHDLPLQPSVKVQAKESDTERRARLLQEAKKSKEKTEKKRLKKQKQKERKRLEKMEKEKQSPRKNEEEKDDEQEPKAGKSKPVNDKSNSSVKEMAAAKDTDSSDSSEDESSDEDDASTKNDSCNSEEELDMTSTFVTKAALIARRKLEKKPKPERKEKKKAPVREAPETAPDKPNKDPQVEKKDSAAPSSATYEDNLKISTDLANLGNQFASVGDYSTAVKYFTDAIKYNPTEFKLFGNRSFCFEKMQEYVKALADAELSLSMCPGWVKGMFRKGRALAGLKRYEEAAETFREVLKLNSSCAEAAQELMRVQITQLMGYGFTREQSSNALIIHGTVQKAVEVLSKLNPRPGAVQNGVRPPAQVANISGVSPVLSANTNPAAPPLQSQDAPKTQLKSKPLGPVQNMSNVKTQPKPNPNQAMKTANEDSQPSQELFPIWVGNLVYPVNEMMITNLFSKVGNVYSVKLLTYKRCAFVNFTKQEYCEEAIKRLNGFELNGIKIAVRYPDRIPRGMGISKSALKADDHLPDENMGQSDNGDGRNAVGSRRPARPYRPVPDHRGNYKH